jgi:hypothetical protein
MSLIYTSSLKTRVWPGTGSPYITCLLFHTIDTPSMYRVLTDHAKRRMNEAPWELLSLEYWTRLWIVQEVILPKDVVVHYGQRQLSWDKFVGILQNAASAGGFVDVQRLGLTTTIALHHQRLLRRIKPVFQVPLVRLLNSYRALPLC